VALGLVLAIGKIVWLFTRLRIVAERSAETKTTTLRLGGSATFLRLPELTAALATVPEGDDVHVQLVGLDHIDHASLDALQSWEKQHTARGGRVFLDWSELESSARRPGEQRRSAATSSSYARGS
jgi:MFS superfamily sulfate permease-like transporter